MATYQQEPNLQSYVSSPYSLPIQSIVGAIQSRQNYWDEGASQVRNAYQNYLNLDLTNKANKDNLTMLMQGVNQGLKKAVQSDLSIASNVGQAMQIFDPIVGGKTEDSQNILGDNALTNHYKHELQVAETARTSNGGKDYSETNVNYLLQGLERFGKDKPGSWREYYGSRRFYTPYYDVAGETKDLLKNFKPNITTTVSPNMEVGKDGKLTGNYNNLYLLSKTDKSAYAQQLNAYLGANLSDKAKRQLAINGAVSYHNNPTILAQDYADYNKQRIDSYNEQIQKLNGVIKGSSDQNLIESSKKQIGDIKDSVDELSDENTKLRSGNSDFFKQNIDRIAGQLYTHNYIENLARANQYLNIDVSYKPDQAAMKWYSENMENTRFNERLKFEGEQYQLNRENRLDIAELKSRGQHITTANFKDFTGTATGDNNENINIKYLNDKLQAAKDLRDQATNRLNEEIESMTGAKLGNLSQTERDQLVNQFISENKGKNPVIDDYFKKFNIANNTEKVYNDLDQYATNEVKRLHPELFSSNEYNPIENVQVKTMDGQNLNLNVPSSKVQEFMTGITETPIKEKDGTISGYRQSINYNGKVYDLQQLDFDKLRYWNGRTKNIDNINSIQTYKNQILDKSFTAIREEKQPIGDQEKLQEFKNLRDDARRLGLKDEVIKDVRIFSTEKDGVNYVLPPGLDAKQLGIDPGQFKTNVEAMGGKMKTENGSTVFFVPWDKLSWEPMTYNDPELNPIKDYFNYRRAVATNQGKNDTTIDAPSTVVYDPNHTGENIRLKMDINSGVPEYFIVYNKKKIFDINTGRGFGSLDQAAAFIKNYITSKSDLDKITKVY